MTMHIINTIVITKSGRLEN